MKQAKASEDDLRQVREFFEMVEEQILCGTYTPPDEGAEPEPSDDEGFMGSVLLLWDKHGEQMPWWMGLCWERPDLKYARVVTVIPLNLLVIVLRELYHLMFWPPSSLIWQRLRAGPAAFMEGWRLGKGIHPLMPSA